MAESEFLFCTCQTGAERALKAEVARTCPEFHLAFSRPGFVTFKAPVASLTHDRADRELVFARRMGVSLGKSSGETDAERAAAVKQIAAPLDWHELHLWVRHERQNELLPPAVDAIVDAFGPDSCSCESTPVSARLVRKDDASAAKPLVLDCAIVEPNQWWLGRHHAGSPQSRWPGGIFPAVLPEHAVSRAYLKMAEALAWSELPTAAGDEVAEIGCTPGGASQALIERGLNVKGIDPAIPDERVLALPQFTHIRKRGHEVKRREFRHTRWLTADMNVAPQYTLDTVEAIVTHRDVNIQGMLLTLKLLDWSLAEQIPQYLDRIRSWGYPQVAARQLSHNRQEVCVAARRQ